MYFEYGEKEVEYLKSKDSILKEVIEQIGHINRGVNPNLFESFISSIVGQQISSKAAATVWSRMQDRFVPFTAETLYSATDEDIQGCGMTVRKVSYIKEICNQVLSGKLNLDELYNMSDEEVCVKLSSINGIGKWTAEMLMIFSMQRSNILSYGDLAILRGMRMVYHHRKITKKMFEKYHRRYSPYASVASLYFWEVASGRYDNFKDYAPKKK